jgi:hypothetical protein
MHTTLLWTEKVWPLQVMVRSEYSLLSNKLDRAFVSRSNSSGSLICTYLVRNSLCFGLFVLATMIMLTNWSRGYVRRIKRKKATSVVGDFSVVVRWE